MQTKQYQIDLNGRPLVAEFSDWAEQANGSVTIKYGETIVMATAVMSDYKKEGMSYFPLSVDYEEKFYAAGKILGSRFMRREGRPSEEAVLNSRMVDRTIRPLFDHRIRNDIQIIITALSVDDENDPDVLAVISASLALAVSDIPWAGPIGAVRIGQVDGKLVANPSYEQKAVSNLDLVICGRDKKINMIEGKAEQIPEDIVLKAFEAAVPEIDKLEQFQNKIVKEIGKEKKEPDVLDAPEDMKKALEKNVKKGLEEALSAEKDKHDRNAIFGELKKEWMDFVEEKYGPEYLDSGADIFEKKIDEIIHINILEKDQRPDGRKINEVRTIATKAGVLPRAHGSGLFYRGQTHMLSVATLGAPGDFLIIEGMEVSEKRRFIHHYNFPPFSSGETGRVSGPGRREIGHGALAERALLPVIPSTEDFPYTIRLVSETLSSNGSSSMGAVCGSTLALMDAGIPIKAPVSGIAMGLMMKNEKEYKILADIQGPEDHHGDTDFKVAGTKDGVTAIQMDVKIDGLTTNMLKDLLDEGKNARLEILKNMLETISEPRKEISPFAPYIITININPDKIRDVIGPGGKIINKIKIDIEQDGKIFITAKNEQGAQKAKKEIEELTYEPQIGESFKGVVSRIFDFGAMVEIKPGVEGLVHISELAPFRVEKVTDVVKTGDLIPVKIISVDELGRINLSLKKEDPDYAKRKQPKGDSKKQ
jgi:polyribonucleotide nucleotidyltransferase